MEKCSNKQEKNLVRDFKTVFKRRKDKKCRYSIYDSIASVYLIAASFLRISILDVGKKNKIVNNYEV